MAAKKTTKRTVKLKKRKVIAKKVAVRKDGIKTLKLNMGRHSGCMVLNGTYESSTPSFALCSDINKKNNSVTMVSLFTGCRESLSAYAHSAINKDGSYALDYGKFSKNKTCVLVSINTGTDTHGRNVIASGKPRMNITYKEWVPKAFKASLKLINHYEKRQKWAQTKLYEIDYDPPVKKTSSGNKKARKLMIYCFIGSRWWISSPQSFSLFNLFIRLGRFKDVQALRSNSSHTNVIKTLKHVRGAGAAEGFNDQSRVFVDKWEVFFNNFKKIYKGRELKSNWKPSIKTYEGIQALTNDYCSDAVLRRRFEQAMSLSKK